MARLSPAGRSAASRRPSWRARAALAIALLELFALLISYPMRVATSS